MKLENNMLKLEVENMGGEMTSLLYKGKEILYDGKGLYWKGKNPSLFPIISSPNEKKYYLNGIEYPIKNHGLIRYLNLDTIKEDDKEIIMELKADEETLKSYPFDFSFKIGYSLDQNKVIIKYQIKNNGDQIMPFTLGLHTGYLVNDKNAFIRFNEDEEADIITNNKTKETKRIKLGDYKYQDFIADIKKYETVILKPLKTKIIELVQKDYKIKVDMSNFKYLALWTPCEEAEFMCIEPWMSENYIKETTNPFSDEFELIKLKKNEVYETSYTIEVLD